MTQALRKLVTFDEFVAQYPDNSQRRYELHDGVIVEMAQQATMKSLQDF